MLTPSWAASRSGSVVAINALDNLAQPRAYSQLGRLGAVQQPDRAGPRHKPGTGPAPPFAATSRHTVDGARPSWRAIPRIDSPVARPREIPSRSASDSLSGDRRGSRLGVPLVVFVLLIDPLTAYLGSRWRTMPLGTRAMEVGVLWFVAALLVFSLAYAALRRARPAPAPRRSLQIAVLAAAAAVIAVSSFAVWQVWPANAVMFLNLRVGGWPQGAVPFALGVLGAEAGWLDSLPPVLARRLGWAAAAGVAALLTLRCLWSWPAEQTGRWSWAPTCPRWHSRCWMA